MTITGTTAVHLGAPAAACAVASPKCPLQTRCTRASVNAAAAGAARAQAHVIDASAMAPTSTACELSLLR